MRILWFRRKCFLNFHAPTLNIWKLSASRNLPILRHILRNGFQSLVNRGGAQTPAHVIGLAADIAQPTSFAVLFEQVLKALDFVLHLPNYRLCAPKSILFGLARKRFHPDQGRGD